MRTHKSNASDRVGMYLNPHTRNRLNQLKADLTLQTGRVHSQDDAIIILLDHYAASRLAQAEQVAEYA